MPRLRRIAPASEKLYKIKDRTFAHIGAKLAAGAALTEHEVQQAMMGWFQDEGLLTDHAPIVARAGTSRAIRTTAPSRSA